MNRPSGGSDDQCLLLVEGVDDKAVVIHLRRAVRSLPSFRASGRGGVRNLLDAIQSEVQVSGRRAVGIVVDANEGLEQRWRAVSERLRVVGVRVPMWPDEDGTIVKETTRLPRIGIWLMPDNRSDGELEDFLIAMLPGDDPVWPRSETYVDGIPSGDRKFKEGKTRRAKLHAWLATRKEPRRSGLAIETADLRLEGSTVAMKFVEWLRRLFGDVK